MNRSGAPGIRAQDVIPAFKKLDFELADPGTVYVPALTVTGAGALYFSQISTDDAVTSINKYLRITLDGVEIDTYSGAESSSDAWFLRDIRGTLGGLSKTEVFPMYLPFKTSMIIEGRFNAVVVAGKKMFIDAFYGEA